MHGKQTSGGCPGWPDLSPSSSQLRRPRPRSANSQPTGAPDSAGAPHSRDGSRNSPNYPSARPDGSDSAPQLFSPRSRSCSPWARNQALPMAVLDVPEVAGLWCVLPHFAGKPSWHHAVRSKAAVDKGGNATAVRVSTTSRTYPRRRLSVLDDLPRLVGGSILALRISVTVSGHRR